MESMPETEDELVETKYSYKVLIFQGYHIAPNMQELKRQGRLVVRLG